MSLPRTPRMNGRPAVERERGGAVRVGLHVARALELHALGGRCLAGAVVLANGDLDRLARLHDVARTEMSSSSSPVLDPVAMFWKYQSTSPCERSIGNCSPPTSGAT